MLSRCFILPYIWQAGYLRISGNMAIKQQETIHKYGMPEGHIRMSNEVVKSTFRFSKSLMKDVKRYSVESESSITGIIDAALREYMKNHPLKKEK
jgi:hypothetical protein